MRDLLSKLDRILLETTLQDIKDHPMADDPVIAKAIDAKEREEGSADQDVDESGLQYYIGKKKFGKDGMKKLAQAGRDGASEEELGRIKDQYKKEGFEIGDDFGISFSEDFEIATEIVGLTEDGLVIELDEVSMEYLQRQGFTFEEGELVEDKKKGVDGKACWKGYRYAGREQKADGTYKDKCVKVGEDLEEEQGVSEAEYQGRQVPLGKPMKGDVKKSKVYVKNAKGNVVKVNFGDKKMRIKKSNPNRRKSFRARHNCKTAKDRTTARYWSCRAW
jgi:hypothetical protein